MKRVLIAIALAIAAFLLVYLAINFVLQLKKTEGPKPAPPKMVVQEGVVYRIISIGTVKVKTSDEQVVRCYLVTFEYPVIKGDKQVSTRGTLPVPVKIPVYDQSLPLGTLKIDPVMTIEGINYGKVRWNPKLAGCKQKKLQPPTLAELEPLTK